MPDSRSSSFDGALALAWAALRRAGGTVSPLRAVALTLGAGLGLTALAVGFSNARVEIEARAEFERLAHRAALDLSRELHQPAIWLRGASAALRASLTDADGALQRALGGGDLQAELRGVSGVGFAERVLREPDAGRQTPAFNAGELQAFVVNQWVGDPARGLTWMEGDLARSPDWRAAIDRAVQTREAVLVPAGPAGSATLGTQGQWLYLLAVFDRIESNGSAAGPGERLRGVLMVDLSLPRLLGPAAREALQEGGALLHLKLREPGAPDLSAARPVLDIPRAPASTPSTSPALEPASARYTAAWPVPVAGRSFELVASSTPAFDEGISRARVAWVLAAGLLVSTLAAWAAWLLVAGRRRAERLAAQLGTDVQRLAEVARHTGSAVIITDARHRIEWVNEGFSNLLGYSLDEVRGLTAGVLFDPGTGNATEDQLAASMAGEGPLEAMEVPRGLGPVSPAAAAAVARADAEPASGRGAPPRMEVVLRTRDGRSVWAELEVQMRKDASGRLIGFVEVASDITARKKAEQGLQEALADASRLAGQLSLMANVARHTSNSVIVTDVQRRITWVNPSFERITGWRLDEVVGRNPGAVLQGPQTDPFALARMRAALDGLQRFSGELLNVSKTGRPYWVSIELQPLFDAEGRHTGFMALQTEVTEARAAREALADERRRLGQVIDATRVGTAEWDVASGSLEVNAQLLTLLGYRLEDLEPLSFERWVSLWHPNDVAAARSDLLDHFRGVRRMFRRDVRMKHRDGRWIWTEVQGSVVSRDASGQALRVAGIVADISERREVADRWQARAEMSADGFWQTDAEHRFVDPQAGTALRDLGLRRDECPWNQPPEEGWGRLQGHLDRREPFTGITYRCLPQGSTQWQWVEIDGRPRLDAGGQFIGYQGVVRNVTEARRMLQELRDGMALVESVFEALPLPVVMKDLEGRYVRINRAALADAGLGSQDVLGRKASEVFDEATAARHEEEEAALLKEPGARQYELRQPLPDGRWVDYLVHKRTVLDAAGRPIGSVGTLVDITSQREAARASQEARDAAEAANRAKSAFLATISHEIRTPMNGVIGMAELLAADSALQPEQAEAAQTVLQSARTLLRLLDDVLDFSKIEAGRMELERTAFDLTATVEGVCHSLSGHAAAKAVDLLVFVHPALDGLRLGDPTRLTQILNNLVGNAIKFSSRGGGQHGQVQVRVEPDAEAGMLRFSVRDDGIGMDEATLGKLFDPFVQAEASTTRRFGGTGLGLAICRRLVDGMGGRISVQSRPGEGSEFRVHLDLPPCEADGAQDDSARKRVLDGVRVQIQGGTWLPAADLQCWLEAAGAQVQALPAGDGWPQEAIAGHPLVLIEAEDEGLPLPGAPRDGVGWLRLGRGRRTRARSLRPDLLEMDLLRRSALVDAVAQLAGRSGGSPHREDRSDADFQALTDEQARARGRWILVAEDDPINRRVIERQLRRLGHAAQVVCDGEEALQAWREHRHALVLTDLHMPRLDGYGLAAAIRADEAVDRSETGRHRTPILALTANALRDEAAKARATGMDDYLTKPIPLEQLRQTLEPWLPPLPRSSDVAAPPPTLPPGRKAEAAPTASRAVSVLDVGALVALVGHDRGTVRGLLEEFGASARKQAGQMAQARADADPAAAARAAHSLKSSAKAVGATGLAEACEAVERLARAAAAAAGEADCAAMSGVSLGDSRWAPAMKDFEDEMRAVAEALPAVLEEWKA